MQQQATHQHALKQGFLVTGSFLLITIPIVIFCIHTAMEFLQLGGMDFRIFYWAAEAVMEGRDIYTSSNPDEPEAYIYPPLVAILFTPLTMLSLEQAGATWTIINGILSFACIGLGAREITRRFKGRQDASTTWVVAALGFLILLPRFKAEIDQGQTDLLVLLAVIGALILVGKRCAGCRFVSGLLLGLAANVKYQTLIFMPYLLFRRQWTTAAGLASGFLLGAFSGILIFGAQRNMEYLGRAFGGLARMTGLAPPAEVHVAEIYPMTWHGSLAIPSVIGRWVESLDGSMVMTVSLVGLTAGLLLLIGWLIYRQRGVPLFLHRAGDVQTGSWQASVVAMEWASLMVAAIVFSPQAKIRHFVLLLPLSLIVAQLLVIARRSVPRWPLLLLTILMFLGWILPPESWMDRVPKATWRLHGGPVWLLLAMLMCCVWTALGWARQEQELADS